MDEIQQLHDEWLALRCQTGDLQAFRELVDELEAPLLYYAVKATGSLEAGKDVLQEAWIKASRDINRLERPRAVRSWLYRLVHGLAVDRVRRDITRERAEDASLDMTAADDDLRISKERAEEVHRALDQLAPKHREVLVLYFLEDFSVAEIAEITRTSTGTVKSRLHYAKTNLRSLLESLSL